MTRTAPDRCGCQGCATRTQRVVARATVRSGPPSTTAELLTIGQMARAAHVTTSALRFYEGEGLVVPAARTSAGYRLYGAEQVDRIRFLRRAQRLGLTLAEVGDLLASADSHPAQPVREQLRDMVRRKIDSVRRQADELREFADELEQVHHRLDSAPGSGCQHVTACGCLSMT